MKRGFTLIEAGVTLAIMGIVAMAAISSFGAFTRLAKQVERDIVLIESLRTAMLYIRSELRLAGGVGVQPWASAIVEDSCAARGGLPDCRQSDRLTLVQGIPTYPGCRVVEDFPGEVRFESSGGCCFHENDFVRQAALLFPGSGVGFGPGDETMQPVVLRSVGSDCRFRVNPIIADSDLPRPLSKNRSFRTRGRRDAVAVLVDIKTFYVEWTDGQKGDLKMHVDLDGDNSVVGERLTVLEDVVDFQASIGYAVPGRSLLENDSGNGDSWWPSTTGEAGNAEAGDPALRPESAVFVGVAAIVVAGGGGISHVQTPWGPVRTLTGLRTSLGAERIALQGD